MLSVDGRYVVAHYMDAKKGDPELREVHELRVRLEPQLGDAHRYRGSDEFGHRRLGIVRRRGLEDDRSSSFTSSTSWAQQAHVSSSAVARLVQVLYPYVQYCKVAPRAIGPRTIAGLALWVR